MAVDAVANGPGNRKMFEPSRVFEPKPTNSRTESCESRKFALEIFLDCS